MDCAVDSSDPLPLSAPPIDAVRVKQVHLSHPSGERVSLSIEFATSVPPRPQSVVSSDSGQSIDAPGSLTYSVMLWAAGNNESVQVMSARTANPWSATEGVYEVDRLRRPTPKGFHPNRNLLVSQQIAGNILELALDLDGIPRFFGRGQFTPNVRVMAERQGLPTSKIPEGQSTPFYVQNCNWDNAPTAAPTHQGGESSASPQRPRTSQPQPVPAPPAPTSVPPEPAGGKPSLPDADAQGFLNYPGGRCNQTDLAVAIARTAQSLVVICQTGVGRFHYRGFGLTNGLSIEIDDPMHDGVGFVVMNKGVRYSVSPDALVISEGSSVLSNEPMLEYWSE
jgi:hypothetical protein